MLFLREGVDSTGVESTGAGNGLFSLYDDRFDCLSRALTDLFFLQPLYRPRVGRRIDWRLRSTHATIRVPVDPVSVERMIACFNESA